MRITTGAFAMAASLAVATIGIDVGTAAGVSRWDASLDLAFGWDGVVLTDLHPVPVPDPVPGAGEMEVLSDGAVVQLQREGGVAALGWVDADGEDLGYEAIHGPECQPVTAFALDRDDADRLIVVGSVGTGSARRPFATRFLPDGHLDPTFGDGGMLLLDPGAAGSWRDVAVDGQRIVAVGEVDGPHVADILVTRLGPTGQPDPTFGTGGHQVVEGSNSDNEVAVGPMGEVRITVRHQGVLGLTPTGSVDPGFGTAGIAPIPGGAMGATDGVAVDGAGRSVVGVAVAQGWWLYRLDAAGRLDPTFGTDGIVRNATDNGTAATGLALQPDGRIILTGAANHSSHRQLAVGRRRADGSADPTFGANGWALVDLEADSIVARDVAVDGYGRLVAGARATYGTHERYAVVRHHAATPSSPLHLELPSPLAPRAGYWVATSLGVVSSFGHAAPYGNLYVDGVDPTTAIAAAPNGNGYWGVHASGRVDALGDAEVLGARPPLVGGERVTSISPTPDGRGYWLFTDLGRVFAYGTARHHGDMAGIRLNGPVLGSVATPSGGGYYMVASDGGIFAFGDARFAGSMGGHRLNQPVVGLAPDADGTGYWLVAADGGIFAFDAPFLGSMGGIRLVQPVVGAIRYGSGYLLVAKDGGIFNFSERPFQGSLGGGMATGIIAVAGLAS